MPSPSHDVSHIEPAHCSCGPQPPASGQFSGAMPPSGGLPMSATAAPLGVTVRAPQSAQSEPYAQ